MLLSQKCQYAFRGIYELAKRYGTGEPLRVCDIARVQAIPPRFLEQIFTDLRKGGFVASRRGHNGGFTLAIPPDKLTVGAIIRFIEGPLSPVACIVENGESDCSLQGHCDFAGFWERVREALEKLYDGTTFQDLLKEAQTRSEHEVVNFTI